MKDKMKEIYPELIFTSALFRQIIDKMHEELQEIEVEYSINHSIDNFLGELLDLAQVTHTAIYKVTDMFKIDLEEAVKKHQEKLRKRGHIS